MVAHVGLVSRVGAQVGLQAAALVEAAAAHLAAVGLLPGVDELVPVDVTGVTEALPTRATGVGFLSRVHCLMVGERGLMSEVAPTYSAVERPLLAVFAVVVDVDLEVGGGLEAPVADVTDVRPLCPSVLLLVAPQLGVRGELLATSHTGAGQRVAHQVLPHRLSGL